MMQDYGTVETHLNDLESGFLQMDSVHSYFRFVNPE